LIDSGPSDHGRWDAPAGEFITLYAASDLLGAFVETLPYFRGADPNFLAVVEAEVDEDEPDVEVDYELEVTPGFFRRVLGRARLQDPGARFVDVDDPRTHAQLNRELPDLLAEHGLDEFDRGVMMSQNRVITRTIAGHLHHQLHGQDLGGTRVVGIRFESRRYREQACWAIWDDVGVVFPEADVDVDPIVPAIPELREAAELLGLRLPDNV
jgi:hypothetical protein